MIAQTAAHGITPAQRLVPLLVAVVVVLMSVELIRRRKLREEYAMLWIFASAVILLFALVPQLLLWISDVVGVYYLTMTVAMGFAFLSVVIIHLAVAASRAADDIRKMAQRMALLEQKLRAFEDKAIEEDGISAA